MSDLHEPFDDEEVVEPKAKKKRGRPKNENYIPWGEARDFIRGEMIPSRGKFFEWWDRNKPKAIPRFPYRVYKDEWTSWNDFLGTDNKFNEKIGTKWRPITEATTFTHSLGLKSQQEWMDWCRIDDNLPKDIPARPDLVYDEWRSWGHWLGNRPVQAIEAKKEAAKTHVYYLIHEQDTPQNIVLVGIEPGGLSAMKERWERERFDIIKLFWYDQEKSVEIKKIVDALSSPYRDYASQRLVPNVWEIVYHLQMVLEIVTKEQMVATSSQPATGLRLT